MLSILTSILTLCNQFYKLLLSLSYCYLNSYSPSDLKNSEKFGKIIIWHRFLNKFFGDYHILAFPIYKNITVVLVCWSTSNNESESMKERPQLLIIFVIQELRYQVYKNTPRSSDSLLIVRTEYHTIQCLDTKIPQAGRQDRERKQWELFTKMMLISKYFYYAKQAPRE